MGERYPHPITTLGREVMKEAEGGAVRVAWDRQRALHYSSANHFWVDHSIVVAHNPYARRQVSPRTFEEYVQFMDIGDGYGWSDGERL